MNEHSTQGFDKSMVMVSFIVAAFTALRLLQSLVP